MIQLKKIFLLLISALVIHACAEQSETEPVNSGRSLDYRTTVFFHANETDTAATLRAAVADTDAERSAGLMNIHDMPMDRGMLFLFDDEEPRSFWMANTPLALDIIFVSADREIIRIHRDTQPYSERNVVSERPAMYVIETNAGYTLQHDIQEGMRISFDY